VGNFLDRCLHLFGEHDSAALEDIRMKDEKRLVFLVRR
jgi:hypothetical protein